jgi:hypothetical protein
MKVALPTEMIADDVRAIIDGLDLLGAIWPSIPARYEQEMDAPGACTAQYEGWLARGDPAQAKANALAEMRRCARLSASLEEALLAAYRP